MKKWFYRLIDWKRCKRKFDVTLFAGAGNVNFWGQSDPRTETRKLAKAGIPCYHIEAMGWSGTLGYTHLDDVIDKLDEVIFWCRRRRIALFVSAHNDNAHLSKYGNRPVQVSQHMPAMDRLFRHLKKRVWSGLFVQPSGETQTSAGRAVEALAAGILPHVCLVSNGDGGRPARAPSWAAHFAYHAARIADKVPAGAWDVTDHGNRLNELGGVMSQTYNSDRIVQDAAKARGRGTPYVLYMFWQHTMSNSNLAALARGYYS